MERACENCGTRYTRAPSVVGRFCSSECAYAGLRKARTEHRRIRRDLDHPLAGRTGLVAEARAVLFDRVGWGPHPCHWCGKLVDWQIGQRGQPSNALVADHLDSDPLNDNPSNLVVACGRCNGQRSRPREFPVNELQCERCGRTVYAAYRRQPPILCRNCKRRKAPS